MKLAVKTEDGKKYFRYDTCIKGNVCSVFSERKVSKNKKTFNLNLDFTDFNARISKIDEFVILTVNGEESVPTMQFIIDKNCVFDELPDEIFKEMLKPAFDALEIETLQDLLNKSN